LLIPASDNMDTRTKYFIIVLLSALVVALESVAVEGALNIADIDILLVTTVPVLIGGLILLFATPRSSIHFVKSLERRGWIRPECHVHPRCGWYIPLVRLGG